MTDNIDTTAALIEAAAKALIRRDGPAIERLMVISNGWLQMEHETYAQSLMLRAMAEAAYLLIDDESSIEVGDTYEDEDA